MAAALPPPSGSQAPDSGARPVRVLGQQRGAWRGCWRWPNPGGVGGPGPRWGGGGREGASRYFSGRHPLGHPAQPRTTRKRIFQPPALETHLSESNESGCRWRLRNSSLVVKGSWGFSPSSVSTWLDTYREDGGRGRGRPCSLPALAVPGHLGLFCVESRGVRGAGARPPSSSPGFPRSPRPAPQPGRLGPRPALLPQPPAGRAETRARGGGTRGGWGSGAAPTLEANWVMDGEGGARGEGGRAGRPRPRWTEPPGSLLPPAERGCPFSAA